MGYIFERRDITLWSPSKRVGEIFLSQLNFLGHLVCIETGFVEEASDLIEVDDDKLRVFLEKMADEFLLNNNASLKNLVRGVIVQAVSIYIRCGRDPSLLKIPSDWCKEAVGLEKMDMPK